VCPLALSSSTQRGAAEGTSPHAGSALIYLIKRYCFQRSEIAGVTAASISSSSD
jgi:hypothetical protein